MLWLLKASSVRRPDSLVMEVGAGGVVASLNHSQLGQLPIVSRRSLAAVSATPDHTCPQSSEASEPVCKHEKLSLTANDNRNIFSEVF